MDLDNVIGSALKKSGIGLAEFAFRANISAEQMSYFFEGEYQDEEIRRYVVIKLSDLTGTYVGEFKMKFINEEGNDADDDVIVSDEETTFFFSAMKDSDLKLGETLSLKLSYDNDIISDATWGRCQFIVRDDSFGMESFVK